ncbi:uncharacterized protein LOC108112172 [Drosophila eugracilis]|uniref:uncharacterized protein LOC108112172 n=1 Tax=Drosophila eugracilis TaxID=29029 RepID=UPI001BD94877|nr:uncharacterized protein LOC108112172 [Drosophila eugracilis]
MAGNELFKPTNLGAKHNQFICPIVYKNEMPELSLGCKYLPCGKDLLASTMEPVSFLKQETKFEHHFKGLHLLFDVNLVDQKVYDKKPTNRAQQMDPRDAALLVDIEALNCGSSKPRPSRAQECAQMFAKERAQIPRPRLGLQRPIPEAKSIKIIEPVSLEQQKNIIGRTFVDVTKPLLKHPTKPGSKAHPVSVLPVLPDIDLLNYNFVQLQFDIPPNDTNNLIRDCGNYMLNFSVIKDPKRMANTVYVSDQRYKEEKIPETSDRGERFILRERIGALYYVSVEKHIKLKRERPGPQTMANKCLLQVKRVPMVKE